MYKHLEDTARRLNPAELVYALYMDKTTEAWNRKAFEESSGFITLALVDVDSLKWVNDNLGHREGDRLLRNVARMLQDEFGSNSVFRLSGDEFVVSGSDYTDLCTRLNAMRSRNPASNLFSFGIGTSLPEADTLLRHDKAWRERHGERAERGERPCWLKEAA